MKINFEELDMKKIIGFIVILVMLITGCWYILSYSQKKPEASFAAAQKAIAQHDLKTFSKHVDLTAIYDNAFGDMTTSFDQASGDAKKFNQSISDGLLSGMRQTTVKKAVEVTEEAVKGNIEASNDIADVGVFGKSIEMFCKNMNAENPEIRLIGFNIISQNEYNTDIQLTFLETKENRQIPLKLRMDVLPDGKWRIFKILNIREAFNSCDYLFNGLFENLRKSREELSKLEAEKDKNKTVFNVLPEKERYQASRYMWKLLRTKSSSKTENGNLTTYRFGSTVHDKERNVTSLSVFNDFIIDKATNRVRNTATLLLTTANNLPLDYDQIYFSSYKKGLVIDPAKWDLRGLGTKVSRQVYGEKNTVAFITTTDGLEDVYSLVYEGNMFISFYHHGKEIVTFEADEKLRNAILDAVSVNDIVKKKLRVDVNRFEIMPIPDNDTLEDIFVEGDKKKKDDKNKVDGKEVKDDKDTKDSNDKSSIEDKKETSDDKKEASAEPVKEEAKPAEATEEKK